MVARLVAEEGELKGLVLSLESGDSWTIGRDPEQCELVLKDPLASRRHAIAHRTSEGILIENLSTTNPLQINEEVLAEPRILQNGDILKIGSEIFRFYLDNMTMENTSNSTQNNHLLNSTEALTSENPDLAPASPELEGEEEDSIFDGGRETHQLADINFNITETGRWLLKVIGGPNTGAEFYMQTGQNYVIGTDPHSCDIVFHDTSVSRQHARISITEDDTLWIEDLRSRNGILINGERLLEKQHLSPSVIVSAGTTSFVVYDREGEMQTIISPLLPSIVKVLQKDEEKQEEEQAPIVEKKEEVLTGLQPATPKSPRNWGPFILFSIIFGLFSLMGIATYSLFKTEPVVEQVRENANELISQVITQFPYVKFSYNKGSGNLLLLGHVSTSADKSQLLYGLQGLNFIKSIDDSGVIIDEYVWREINSVVSRNPAWQGISIHSPAAGEFVLSGYLKTKKQAEALSDYLSLNFPYLDLLKNQVIVEEDVIKQIELWLQQYNLRNVAVNMVNGEINLTGDFPSDKTDEFNSVVQQIKDIQGVRVVNNLTKSQAPEMGIINISDQYEVTGQSRLGEKYTVVVNGRILSEGDIIDGMTISRITPNTIFLNQGDLKYRIDYR